MASVWTVAAAMAAARDYLNKYIPVSSRLEAEVLLAHALQVSRVDLYAEANRPLTQEERLAYRRLLKERSQGKPLQYITGRQQFRYLDLRLEPGVFIPRPETELLVEALIKRLPRDKTIKLLELGVGSGAISLSLAKELPLAEVVAVDMAEVALRVAAENAAANNLADRVLFRRGDLFAALDEKTGGPYDALVANPPYVVSAEIAALERQVRDHEPLEALDGGEDGLDYYRRIAGAAAKFLKLSGIIAFEVGMGQAPVVQELLRSAGFAGVSAELDYNQIERIVLGRAPAKMDKSLSAVHGGPV